VSLRSYFSKEEYRKLLILTFLGEWAVNAHRTDDHKKDFEEVADKILAFAGQFDLNEYVDKGDASGKIYPSGQLEDESLQFMDEYEEHYFWDELADRLAERDMERRYGLKRLQGMDWETKFVLRGRIIDRYNREFTENGLDHLRVGFLGSLKRFFLWIKRGFREETFEDESSTERREPSE
jgi:hypothetical protein